jgi:DNA-binding response OmpR family regulator
MPEDRRRALEAGFDAHITKPVTLNAILELLASLSGRQKEPSGHRAPDRENRVRHQRRKGLRLER